MQQFVTADKISLLSQAACKLKQAWHINSTGRYKLKHRGAWRRKKGECFRRKALQKNAKEDEQCTCSRSKEAQLQEETRARHKGRSVSKGAQGDTEKVQRNAGERGWGGSLKELTALYTCRGSERRSHRRAL